MEDVKSIIINGDTYELDDLLHLEEKGYPLFLGVGPNGFPYFQSVILHEATGVRYRVSYEMYRKDLIESLAPLLRDHDLFAFDDDLSDHPKEFTIEKLTGCCHV